MRLGIISALIEEQHGLIEAMEGPATLSHAMRTYTVGKLWNIDAVCVLSRIGKVAAAMTATTLVEKFGVTHIVFTGVAGSADPKVHIGDVVVAQTCVQHDMDARPLFPQFEVPLTSLSHFSSDTALSERLAAAATQFLRDEMASVIGHAVSTEFALHRPSMHRGLIGSGDQFIHSAAHVAQLKQALPELLAVEMEGAAVAQVCFELGVPFAVVRTISDNANAEAAVDFMRFVQAVASVYAFNLVRHFCLNLNLNLNLSLDKV